MRKLTDILAEIRPEYNFAESDNFFEDSYIDSFDLISLVSALDEEFKIKIKGTDIVPENFCNLEEIKRLVKGYGVEDDI